MAKKKTLTLDYSKWVAGDGKNKVGSGSNNFLNDEGNMCVLGQFIPQLSPKTTLDCIRGKGMPSALSGPIEHLSREVNGEIRDTALANRAVNINDAITTTPDHKIKMFRKLFGKIGYNVEVINHPKQQKL